jgi:hypothetical protein
MPNFLRHVCNDKDYSVGIDLPPRWPNGHLGLDSCPDRGRPAQTRLVGPRRTVPYKKGVGATGLNDEVHCHCRHPTVLTLARSRGWHCQRREVHRRRHCTITGFHCFLNTVARSSSSTKPHGLRPYLSPFSLSLISIHVPCGLFLLEEYIPADLHLVHLEVL